MEKFYKLFFIKENMKWMKIAGVTGAVVFCVGILFSVLGLFLDEAATLSLQLFLMQNLWIVFLLMFLFFASVVIFLFGFWKMGCYFKSGFLKFSSISFIIALILAVGSVISLSFFDMNALVLEGAGSEVPSAFLFILGFLFLLILFLVVVSYLFYIGIFKLKDKMRLASPVGIAGIVFTSLAILFVLYVSSDPSLLLSGVGDNFFVKSVSVLLNLASVFLFLAEIFILFDASSKFEDKKKINKSEDKKIVKKISKPVVKEVVKKSKKK